MRRYEIVGYVYAEEDGKPGRLAEACQRAVEQFGDDVIIEPTENLKLRFGEPGGVRYERKYVVSRPQRG